MRVFVTGTGRCGTKTFARACGHLTSHTAGHETHRGMVREDTLLEYPDHHVEVDPHLSWMLSLLVERYPDAGYVHLWRPEEEVVSSWERRGIRVHRGAAPLVDVIFQTKASSLRRAEYREALGTLYRSITARCNHILSRQRHFLSVNIWEARERWDAFCTMVGAEGDLEAGCAELGRRA